MSNPPPLVFANFPLITPPMIKKNKVTWFSLVIIFFEAASWTFEMCIHVVANLYEARVFYLQNFKFQVEIPTSEVGLISS